MRPFDGVVLVTGSSGFIGSHLVSTLSRSGFRVRALSRSAPPSDSEGVESICYAGLADRSGLRRALRGVTAVVHLAGSAHVFGRGARNGLQFSATNVTGTQTLLEEAVNAGVKRVVHLSSLGAVAVRSELAVSETTHPSPSTPYGISKLRSEEVVAEICATSGMSYAILRPPMIYGPGMKGNPLRLFDAIEAGLPLPVAGVGNRRSLLYVGNLVYAIELTLRTSRFLSGVFMVGEGPGISSADLVQRIATELDAPLHLFHVPSILLGFIGRIGDVVSILAPVPLTSSTLDRLCESLEVDDSKLRTTTGYFPPYSLEEGLHFTAEWYLETARQNKRRSWPAKVATLHL